MIQKQGNGKSECDLDERIYDRIIKDKRTVQRIEDFSEAIKTACEKSLKTRNAPRTSQIHRSFPCVDTKTYSNEEKSKSA